MNGRKSFAEGMIVFLFGGCCYGLIELLWRGYTHWSMVLTGGAVLSLLNAIRKRLPCCPLYLRCFFGAAVITVLEFLVGCGVNLYGKMGVWDYSRLPLNLLGQICAPYSFLWFLLCLPANGLCKVLSGKLCLSSRR